MPTFRRKDGVWLARYFVTGHPGERPRRHTRSFPDQGLAALHEWKMDFERYVAKYHYELKRLSPSEVDRWVTAFMRRRKVHAPLNRTEISLALIAHATTTSSRQTSRPILEAIETHIAAMTARGASKGTIANYRSCLTVLKPILAKVGVTHADDINSQFPTLLAANMPGRTRRTVDIYVETIKAALNTVGEPPGPWQELKRLEQRRRTRIVMSIDEVARFLAQARKDASEPLYSGRPFWYSLFYVLYITARRLSEITERRWADVKPETNMLVIARQKGDAGPVYCPLNDEELRAILSSPLAGISPEHIFQTRSGRPVNNKAVETAFKEIARAAGLPANYSPHYLRHASTTYLGVLNPQATQKDIMAITGHKTAAAFAGYNHVLSAITSNIRLANPEAVLRALRQSGTSTPHITAKTT